MGGCNSRLSLLGRDWVFQAEQPASKETRKQVLDSSPDPKVLTAESMLGRSLNEQQLHEAELMMNECIARFPGHSRAYLVRGRIRYASQQWQAAVKDLTAAIDLQPNFGQAFYTRSQAYVKLSMLESAIQDYKRAMLVDPDNSQLAALKAEIAQAHAATPSPAKKAGDGAVKRGQGASSAAAAATAAEDVESVADDSTTAKSVNKADLPRLRVESELVESDDPFAAVDTPNDVAAANKLCSVCMDSERNCRLRPCMHAALCTECAQNLMSRRFGCPICDCRIDSLERGSFMCTFSGDQQVSSLAKSIQEVAALRRQERAERHARAAAAGSQQASQQTSPDVSPTRLHLSPGYPSFNAISPSLYGLASSPDTPSVLSSIYSPTSSHYTPQSSRPNTTLPTVVEVQETPFMSRNTTEQHQVVSSPPSPRGQLTLTPHSTSRPSSSSSPRLTLTPPSQQPQQDQVLPSPLPPSLPLSQQQQQQQQEASPITLHPSTLTQLHNGPAERQEEPSGTQSAVLVEEEASSPVQPLLQQQQQQQQIQPQQPHERAREEGQEQQNENAQEEGQERLEQGQVTSSNPDPGSGSRVACCSQSGGVAPSQGRGEQHTQEGGATLQGRGEQHTGEGDATLQGHGEQDTSEGRAPLQGHGEQHASEQHGGSQRHSPKASLEEPRMDQQAVAHSNLLSCEQQVRAEQQLQRVSSDQHQERVSSEQQGASEQ